MQPINLHEIVITLLTILTIAFGLIGTYVSIKYQRGFIDYQGAKIGMRKSIKYFLLLFFSGGLTKLLRDPTNWLTSIFIFVGGSVFVFFYYKIRIWQISVTEKAQKGKYEDFGKHIKH